MIAVDTNILVYAHRRDSPFHEAASLAVQRLAERRRPWAIPWPCLHEFLGIVTNPRIFKQPTPIGCAIDQVQSWLDAPSIELLSETVGYWERLHVLAASAHVVGAQIHDARIAVLCTLHSVGELWTADRDFSRFPELRTRNPLTHAIDL